MIARLALIGHFPPPLGGVAVHLLRLQAALKENHIAVDCLSFNGENPAIPHVFCIKNAPFRFVSKMVRGYRLVHYHTDERDWKAAILLSLWCKIRRQPFVLTLHSFRNEPFLRQSLLRFALRRAYLSAKKIICISENLQKELALLLDIPKEKTFVIPSFIPIFSGELSLPMHPNLAEFIKDSHDQKHLLISFYAGGAKLFNGEDLYGSDLVLSAFAELSRENPALRLVMIFSERGDEERFSAYRQQADSLGESVFLLESASFSFIPVLAHSDIMIRATLNDGGPSLTVLEALSLGKICLASDSVPRPSGALLFKNGDKSDLVRVLREAVALAKKGEQAQCTFASGADSLIKLYSAFGAGQ